MGSRDLFKSARKLYEINYSSRNLDFRDFSRFSEDGSGLHVVRFERVTLLSVVVAKRLAFRELVRVRAPSPRP